MKVIQNPIMVAVLRFAAGLRFPALFGLVASVFALDLLIPDAIPLADELLLGLVTLALGSLRGRDDRPDRQ